MSAVRSSRLIGLALITGVAASNAAAATFEHFAGQQLPPGWSALTANSGVVCMNGAIVAGAGGACTPQTPGLSQSEQSAVAGSDAAAIVWDAVLPKTTSRIVWITLETTAGIGTVALVDNPSPLAPNGYSTADFSGPAGIVLTRLQIGSSKLSIARYDSTALRARTEWDASKNVWAAPSKTAAVAALDAYVTIGLEIDGTQQRYRWHVIGAAGTTSGPPNYNLHQATVTEWVPFAFHEGSAASYCNPGCTDLRIVIGDAINDAGTQTGAVEWFADDDGPRHDAWANGRNNGGAWDIYRLWGYESAAGHVQRWVPEHRSIAALADGAAGTWDDVHVKDPQVMYDPASGVFHMCYSGANGIFQVGCAWSSSIGGPWLRSSASPIVAAVPGTAEHQVFNPFLLKDLGELDPNKRWKLFYVGADNSAPLKRTAFVRTCANPPTSCAAWTKTELAGPGPAGTLDDLGWLRVMPLRWNGASYLIGSVSQDRAIDLKQETYATFADRWQSPAVKSGVVTLTSQAPLCRTQTSAAITRSRILPVISTAGCQPDQWIIVDDDSAQANYHRNRILRIVDSTKLELYYREDGLLLGALVNGSDAFAAIDAGLPVPAGSHWTKIATCFSAFSGAPSGVRAYDEQSCLFTAASPLGPWTRDELGSPVANTIAGRMHSHENVTMLTLPIGRGTPISGAITSDVTWRAAESPYVLSAPVSVASGVVLTIEPGVVVKSQLSGSLFVSGTLEASGTAQQPIVFTSDRDDGVEGDTNDDGRVTVPAASDWSGVALDAASTGNVLEFVEIRFAGGGGSPSLSIASSDTLASSNKLSDGGASGISVSSASPTISGNRVVRHVTGIRLVDSASLVSGNVISGNANGIELDSSPGAALASNTIAGNSSYGVFNASPAAVVAATGNFWGDASGPFDASDDTAAGGFYNPTGLGDSVSDSVDYSNWLAADPN